MIIKDEERDSELKICTDSIYDFENELKTHSQKEAKYHKWYAQAVKDVDNLILNLEITVAEIMEELLKEYEGRGKAIPPSARAEVRKTEVPKDRRYQLISRKLNEAVSNKSYLFGLTKAWGSRSHRLTEIGDLLKRSLYKSPVVYESDLDNLTDKMEY